MSVRYSGTKKDVPNVIASDAAAQNTSDSSIKDGLIAVRDGVCRNHYQREKDRHGSPAGTRSKRHKQANNK